MLEIAILLPKEGSLWSTIHKGVDRTSPRLYIFFYLFISQHEQRHYNFSHFTTQQHTTNISRLQMSQQENNAGPYHSRWVKMVSLKTQLILNSYVTSLLKSLKEEMLRILKELKCTAEGTANKNQEDEWRKNCKQNWQTPLLQSTKWANSMKRCTKAPTRAKDRKKTKNNWQGKFNEYSRGIS